MQFRDVLRDRPVVAIPDDHDIGQPNLWGANGKRALNSTGPNGGYYYPAEYVKMVERCQTWHLPDPVDPAPVEQGIGVYFTRFVRMARRFRLRFTPTACIRSMSAGIPPTVSR